MLQVRGKGKKKQHTHTENNSNTDKKERQTGKKTKCNHYTKCINSPSNKQTKT